MTSAAFQLDLATARRRTRRTMAVSAVAHAMIIAWLVFFPPASPEHLPPITEIALVDPSDLAGPAAGSTSAGMAAARRAPARIPVDPKAKLANLATLGPDVRFERTDETAVIAPEPQVESAFADRLNARLANLKSDASRVASVAAPSASPSALWSSPAAAGGVGTGGAEPIDLKRGGNGRGSAGNGTGSGGTGSPFALNRGANGTGTGSGALTGLATASLPAERRAAETPADGGGDATARRTLAGASLSGPIADRPIVSYRRPVYPEWAKRELVEGSVTLYFVVLPDGRVKENVMVQKTAGFADFDESARVALLAWRFEPLTAGKTGEQWGTITFHFRLRDTR